MTAKQATVRKSLAKQCRKRWRARRRDSVTSSRHAPRASPHSMILLIDSYDSFTNNLKHLIEANSGKSVVTIFNDTFAKHEYASVFDTWIRHFDSIVVGPGPGHPANEKDMGIIKYLYRRFAQNPDDCVPVLGVCLGFQGLCQEFGNPVTRLDSIKHGQIYKIQPRTSDLFESDIPFDSVRYHSLHVNMSTLNDKIIPLATCQETGQEKYQTGQATLLMAGKHAFLPLYGVQYHPESVCSEHGDELIRRFDALADHYNKKSRAYLADSQKNPSILDYNRNMIDGRAVHETSLWPETDRAAQKTPTLWLEELRFVHPGITAIDVCDYLYARKVDFVLLNSAADPGEWGIIGLPVPGESEVITHSIDDADHVYLLGYKGKLQETVSVKGSSVWEFVASKFQKRYVPRRQLETNSSLAHDSKLPFLGGYMGMFSYEEGKHVQVSGMKSLCGNTTPDTKLVYIERFILCNRRTGTCFVGSIRDKDDEFCLLLQGELRHVRQVDLASISSSAKHLCDAKYHGTSDHHDISNQNDTSDNRDIRTQLPDRETYRQQMSMCQDALQLGDSYELCLTTQLKIFLPLHLSSWEMYKILALKKNPSPYSAYMDFEDCTLVSSSPERFLSWKDSDDEKYHKVAELRPIKGTVKNTSTTTLEDATRLLRTPKEMGENLMIVDLIRHDLQTFTEDVTVKALMTVEEYKTVYQLVSVIQGGLGETGFRGIDVLHLSLPPGSMTGAPKKRSMELLRSIESLQKSTPCGRRGFYSGVAGYWSVTDDADWSVIIRSMVHYKQDMENDSTTAVWRIGAGGAITVLSDEESEWDEMLLKLTSTLQTFF